MNLTPKYKITRNDEHIYEVEINDVILTPPGVTTILEVIGSKDKTNRLMGWAKKNALEKVQEHLRPLIGKPTTIDETFIEAVRKSAWKRDKEKLKEAGDIGTKVHEAIDEYIAGKVPALDDTSRPGFENFMQWLTKSGIKLIKGDTFVYSAKDNYAGALDALGEKDGEIILLDWKTSNYIQDTYAIQAAAYYRALQETYGITASSAYVVRFGKETAGDIEPKKINLSTACVSWAGALALYKSITNSPWEE